MRQIPTRPLALLFVSALLLIAPGWVLALDTAQNITGETPDVLINDHWGYFETSVRSPGELDLADSTPVNLPHSWNSLDATDAEPGYRRDASWYRKLLTFSPSAPDARHFLYFEGANMTADVYVNGQRAGGHVGGYLGFEIEITDYLDPLGVNEILVRVDNSVDRDLIPSQKADFVLYGGLTRDVYLRVRPNTRIARLQIDTPVVSRRSATVRSTVVIDGRADRAGDYRVELEVADRQGNTVSGRGFDIDAGKGVSTHELELPEIEDPQLWSPDSPTLYSLVATLLDKDGTVVHQEAETFGLRWYGFAEDGAFMLNGERLLLRGTHRHEEHAGYGAAMPDELHVRDMELIKGVGANFVRLGHYPQDPSVYWAADRLGLIIWDELPWCRGGMGGDEWKRNTESMLREMITQNRNHPSVFFWSLGNEIYWLPDFEGGDDETAMNDYLGHLNAIAHEMDPSRMTAIRKYYAGWDIVDVFSPSIWAGWYGGGYFQYEDALTDAQAKYPRFLHTEYGGSSHVGRHSWNPPGGEGMRGGQVSVSEMVNQSGVVSVAKAGDWSESYIVDLFDWHLMVSEAQPGFAGNAQWAFKDFATPLRAENPIPYVNQKGLVDREGRPKEAYWVFKSRWSDEPFCHIYGHSWAERHGQPGDTQQIRVYCNTESAQLSLNGVALEEKPRDVKQFPASGLFWELQLEEGLNRLSVSGRNAGKEQAKDTLEVQYSEQPFGKAADVRLAATPGADGRVLIEAVIVDQDGLRVHSADERIYLSHTNPGTGGYLVKDHGTPDKSAVIEAANGRATVLFDPDGAGAGAIIEARTQNLKGSYIKLSPEDVSVQPVETTGPGAYGRFVPEREDDFAWENDKIAFRVYGPRSPAKGPVSGVDAWLKRVDYPVINKWYAEHLSGKSYHEDHGEGYDPYHTGTSRGVGGSAVWVDGVAWPAAQFDRYEVLKNGPKAIEFVLYYTWETPLGQVEEHKTVSLALGEQLYRVNSLFKLDGKPAALPIAIGLTTHDEAAEVSYDVSTGRISTWETIDGSGLGTGALLAPARVTEVVHEASEKKDASHIWLITATGENGALSFRAGFGWDKAGEIGSFDEWNRYLDERAGD